MTVDTTASDLERDVKFAPIPWLSDEPAGEADDPEAQAWGASGVAATTRVSTRSNWYPVRSPMFKELLQRLLFWRQGSVPHASVRTADIGPVSPSEGWALELKFTERAPASAGLVADPEALKREYALENTIIGIMETARLVFGASLHVIEQRLEHDSDFSGDYLACNVEVERGSQEEFKVLRRRFFRSLARELDRLKGLGQAGDLDRVVVSVSRRG